MGNPLEHDRFAAKKMDLLLETKNPFEISNNYFPQQTSFWASLKVQYGWSVNAFNLTVTNSGKTISQADMLLLSKSIGADTQFVYIPYIPFEIPIEMHYGDMLEKLTDKIRPFLPENCLFVRYDVSWESPWIYENERFDAAGNWLGNPAPHIRELRMNYGTRHHGLRKAGTDVLPSNTLFIDINKRPESLLSEMKPKTRYNIRLSKRKGVTVRSAGLHELPRWYAMYRETTRRNHIHDDDYAFFETLWQAQQHDTDTRLFLLLAEKNHTPLAGMFLSVNNKRATYLYGASSSAHRNLMGTYQLQWEAMQLARSKGCTQYDMFGIAPAPNPNHPMYGLYRFKTGFGGRPFHRQGCWDFIFDERRYNLFRATEKQMPGYHN